MKRKNLKTYAFILVSVLTVLSSCETSARYIGSNEWSGSVNQVSPHPNWLPIGQKEVDSSDWWSMTNLEGSYSGYEGIYLYEGIVLTSDNYAFWQNSGSNVTICLHGWTINGVGSSVETYSDGGVISVGSSSTFTIQDCQGGGKIQANKSVESGGVIKVNEGATLNLEGGSLTGGSATYDGGAIYSYKGTVNIKGGSISSNTADKGGGIYNDKGKLVINGGEISGNSAGDGGGIYSDCEPTSDSQGLFINGGTITGNIASYDGGGVKFEHYVDTGDEVYEETESTLHLSGNPYIYDNYAIQNEKSIQYNVETDELSLLAFDGVLTEGALIGVTYSGKKAEKDPPYQISVAESSTTYTQNSVGYIVSDVEYYETKYNDTGNYLILDGVAGYNEVAESSITLTFEFFYSTDTTPLAATNGDKIILPTDANGNDFARIFIEGSWDNYQTEHNLTLDPETKSYYVTLPGLTINYHSFHIYVGYLDNDDHISLSDDNPEFTLMVPLDVDTQAEDGVYNIGFSVSIEKEFSDLVSEDEDVHKVTFTLQFKLWQGSYEQQPLDYGDLYVWTSMNDWSGWMKCYIMEDEWDADGNPTSSHYYLDVHNIEENTYDYSLAIWYNDEEIPDPTEDDSVWDRKVNNGTEGTSGIDNIFTVTDAILAANDELGYIPISVYDTNDLAGLLPFRLKDYTFTFTLYSIGSTIATCPEYGSLYLIGDFHQEVVWEEYEPLTYDEGSGTYSITVPEVYPGTFEYNILFVYNDEGGPSVNSWTHELFEENQTYTIEKEHGNGYVATITHTLGFELGDRFAEHRAALTNYTLRFTIWTESDGANQGREYSTYGYNVYIIGGFTSSDWTTAEICLYTSHYSDVYGETVVSFDFTTNNIFYPGDQYTYKLLYVNTSVDSYVEDWSNPQITGADQTLNIPTDAQNDDILEIEIYSDFWFDNPHYPSS